MAEEDKSTDKPVVEEPKVVEKPASKTPVDSEKPGLSPEEVKRREEQSNKDKSSSKTDDEDRLSFLEARENERMKDEFVNSLLSKEAEKYPDVKADDPLFKYASSEEEVEQIAKDIQNRVIDIRQKALVDVQIEPDEGLTDEQIAEAEEKMEKETIETGRSNFGNFLGNIQRRKR